MLPVVNLFVDSEETSLGQKPSRLEPRDHLVAINLRLPLSDYSAINPECCCTKPDIDSISSHNGPRRLLRCSRTECFQFWDSRISRAAQRTNLVRSLERNQSWIIRYTRDQFSVSMNTFPSKKKQTCVLSSKKVADLKWPGRGKPV